ncbi:amidohydrolase family protein [bacterium]|nr:amidohydrolase family protein [bacterium]
MTIDGYVTLGCERETVYSAEDLVRDLDLAGVDMAVAAPEDREIAVFNRRGNERLAEEARKFPDRIIPACTVNPWYGADAVQELGRATGQGARMLVLHPTVQGFLMNDELACPVLEKVSGLGLTVYVHTGGHLYGGPWQVVDCALRFPDVSFIMGHAGATDFWNDIPYAGASAPNVFIEGSFARPFNFMSFLDRVGIDKGIMGSSAPRNSLVLEWEQHRKYMPPVTYGPVFGDNLARILGIKGGA